MQRPPSHSPSLPTSSSFGSTPAQPSSSAPPYVPSQAASHPLPLHPQLVVGSSSSTDFEEGGYNPSAPLLRGQFSSAPGAPPSSASFPPGSGPSFSQPPPFPPFGAHPPGIPPGGPGQGPGGPFYGIPPPFPPRGGYMPPPPHGMGPPPPQRPGADARYGPGPGFNPSPPPQQGAQVPRPPSVGGGLNDSSSHPNGPSFGWGPSSSTGPSSGAAHDAYSPVSSGPSRSMPPPPSGSNAYMGGRPAFGPGAGPPPPGSGPPPPGSFRGFPPGPPPTSAAPSQQSHQPYNPLMPGGLLPPVSAAPTAPAKTPTQAQSSAPLTQPAQQRQSPPARQQGQGPMPANLFRTLEPPPLSPPHARQDHEKRASVSSSTRDDEGRNLYGRSRASRSPSPPTHRGRGASRSPPPKIARRHSPSMESRSPSPPRRGGYGNDRGPLRHRGRSPSRSPPPANRRVRSPDGPPPERRGGRYRSRSPPPRGGGYSRAPLPPRARGGRSISPDPSDRGASPPRRRDGNTRRGRPRSPLPDEPSRRGGLPSRRASPPYAIDSRSPSPPPHRRGSRGDFGPNGPDNKRQGPPLPPPRDRDRTREWGRDSRDPWDRRDRERDRRGEGRDGRGDGYQQRNGPRGGPAGGNRSRFDDRDDDRFQRRRFDDRDHDQGRRTHPVDRDRDSGRVPPPRSDAPVPNKSRSRFEDRDGRDRGPPPPRRGRDYEEDEYRGGRNGRLPPHGRDSLPPSRDRSPGANTATLSHRRRSVASSHSSPPPPPSRRDADDFEGRPRWPDRSPARLRDASRTPSPPRPSHREQPLLNVSDRPAVSVGKIEMRKEAPPHSRAAVSGVRRFFGEGDDDSSDSQRGEPPARTGTQASLLSQEDSMDISRGSSVAGDVRKSKSDAPDGFVRAQMPPPPPPPPPQTTEQGESQRNAATGAAVELSASQTPADTLAAEGEPEAPAAPEPPKEVYERLVQVGEGTYGKVYKARNIHTGALVALKRIRMEAERDGFPVTSVREMKLLQSLRHPNVVSLFETMVSRSHVYMVFEYVENDLTGLLTHPSINFTPAHLKSLMKQFLEGLGYIHRRGILHRDLKGSNILISKRGELKIADFGLARFFARGRNNDYTNRVITQWYKPPELLFGATVYGEEVDMFSAGCIFLELFVKRPVFQGQDEIQQLDVIFKITGTPDIATWPGLHDLPWYELVKPKARTESKLRDTFSKYLSPGALDVAERLLALNPQTRPSAHETLKMPYFTTEDPPPVLPDILENVRGEWHEYESKRARKRQREEAA